MARARNIKPGFFTNEVLAELSFETRLLFIGLWTVADRAGRFHDRPKKIKMQLFPADSVDVDALLNKLAKAGFIWRYEIDGERYVQIVNWDKHQNPHKHEADSDIPPPVERRNASRDAADDDSASKHGSSTAIGGSATAIGDTSPADSLIPDSLIPDSLIEEKKQPRASRLPNSWEPSDEQIAFCRKERPDLRPQEVAARFRDYWIAQAGQRGRKADWDATWRNWVRSERRQTQPYQTAADKRIAFAEALTGRNRERTDTEIIDLN